MAIQRLYWDTSCFIAYLSIGHSEEQLRAFICRDILHHAQNDKVELFTSAWTMVETIRPRLEYKPSAVPPWARVLEEKDKNGNPIYPEAANRFKEIWEYYDKKHNTPTRKLTLQEAAALEAIFQYPFISKITIDPVIAARAREIARDTKLRPGDSLHVASALAAQCSCIQSWDGDYSETSDLIPWEKPKRLSDQSHLAEIAPPDLTSEGYLFPLPPPPLG